MGTGVIEVAEEDRKLFTVLQVRVTVRSFDVADPPSTRPMCNLVRLALANKHILVGNYSFEHAIFKDMVMQITSTSATGSRGLEGCT